MLLVEEFVGHSVLMWERFFSLAGKKQQKKMKKYGGKTICSVHFHWVRKQYGRMIVVVVDVLSSSSSSLLSVIYGKFSKPNENVDAETMRNTLRRLQHSVAVQYIQFLFRVSVHSLCPQHCEQKQFLDFGGHVCSHIITIRKWITNCRVSSVYTLLMDG